MNGDILKNYKRVLSDIATVRVGFQARGKIEENIDGQFTIIRSQDLSDNGELFFDQLMHFTPPSSIDPEKHLLAAEDILVQARGQNHRAYYIGRKVDNIVASNTFYIIRIKKIKTVLLEFLVWWMNQVEVQTYFKQEQSISTIPFISSGVLLKTPVPVPSLKTQQNICDLMSLWQQERNLYQSLIVEKEKLIQAVAYDVVKSEMEVS